MPADPMGPSLHTLRHTSTKERMHVVNKMTRNFENVSMYAAFETFWQENYSLKVQEKMGPISQNIQRQGKQG